MWIDDGVAHSVALPDPTDAMSIGFRRDLDALMIRWPVEVVRVLEAAEEAVFEEDLQALVRPTGADEFVGAAPPLALLDGSLSTIADLATIVAHTDLRWRLDAVHALLDYVDPG